MAYKNRAIERLAEGTGQETGSPREGSTYKGTSLGGFAGYLAAGIASLALTFGGAGCPPDKGANGPEKGTPVASVASAQDEYKVLGFLKALDKKEPNDFLVVDSGNTGRTYHDLGLKFDDSGDPFSQGTLLSGKGTFLTPRSDGSMNGGYVGPDAGACIGFSYKGGTFLFWNGNTLTRFVPEGGIWERQELGELREGMDPDKSPALGSGPADEGLVKEYLSLIDRLKGKFPAGD